MPSLFVSAVQPRVQAPILPAVAKPSAAFLQVRPPPFSAAVTRSQRQSPVCQAAGRNEPKFDENDYITASVEAGVHHALELPVLGMRASHDVLE